MSRREFTLAELAEQSGVPPRTIRFYIARGLLPGPSVAGRGATYGEEHAGRLNEIREEQARGKTLAEIALTGEPKAALAAPEAWWKYELDRDVTVSVRADAAPWRLHQIRSALDELAARLRSGERENHES